MFIEEIVLLKFWKKIINLQYPLQIVHNNVKLKPISIFNFFSLQSL